MGDADTGVGAVLHSRMRRPVPGPGIPAKTEPVFECTGVRGQVWVLPPEFLRGEAGVKGCMGVHTETRLRHLQNRGWWLPPRLVEYKERQ